MLVDPIRVKNTVKSSVSFYAFGIYERKSCTWNVEEIDGRFLLHSGMITVYQGPFKSPPYSLEPTFGLQAFCFGSSKPIANKKLTILGIFLDLTGMVIKGSFINRDLKLIRLRTTT